MPTMHLMLDAQDRDFKMPRKNGVSFVTLHLKNFNFSDQEVVDYAQAAAMMLLGAVQGARVDDEDDYSRLIGSEPEQLSNEPDTGC